jgi:hypothetical protein
MILKRSKRWLAGIGSSVLSMTPLILSWCLIEQLVLEAERYYKMLDRYKEQHFSESGIIKWKMDDHDKVY